MKVRVIELFSFLFISFLLLNCASKKVEFGHKYEIYDHDSLKSKKYVAHIRNLDASEFKEGKLVGEDITMKYRFLSPKNYNHNKKYPLVLILHGSGAIGSDNTKQLNALAKIWLTPENQRKYPAYIFAPQFPIRSSNYHLDETRKVLTSESNEYLDLVLNSVDSLKQNLNVDETKVYVLGFSMGGSTTMNALSKRPDLFAAGINISGISEFDKMDKLKNIPLWFVHGSLDTDNSPKSNLQFFEEMSPKGKIFFWECKDKWHNNIVSEELINLIPKWLFKQRKYNAKP